jgi:type I restriction enzyme S subunit
MTTEWDKQTFTDCVEPIRVDRGKQVKTREYLSSGKYPIVDQGQGLVAGWTDSEEAVIQDGLPYVVFGDHTRIFKYIDFPFALGADGTKLIKSKDDISPHYFYFHLLGLDIPNRGYSRHYRLLKEKEISLPPLPEQKKIAAVLLKIQRAIETQEKIIQPLRDLKKSTMQHLFTHGLRGEKTKMTEIGEIPKSWTSTRMEDILDESLYGLSMRGQMAGRYPILRMNCQVDGMVVFEDLQYVDLDARTFEKFRLVEGDLLFNRTNSHDLVGRMAVCHAARDAVFASYLIRLRLDRRSAVPDFINYYFNMNATQVRVKILASRGVSQSNISASKLKTFEIPLPSNLDEQGDIVVTLKAVDRKIQLHESKKFTLQDLFKTTLNKLMTGRIRVTDLDIDMSEVN